MELTGSILSQLSNQVILVSWTLGVFYLFSLQEAQSLNLCTSIPLIPTIGGFISKALTFCSLDLFATYCYPTPATILRS